MAMEETIKLEFNGKEVTAPAGVTVHRAAELNGIYIPTLCSHKDLSPYGGCRLCLVEIEGMRGYPLSCNTIAADGMKILTDTVAVQEMRRELLKLILSEHPSACLICDEAEECKNFQGTVRKSGVTTGCRYCPNDGKCELQDLVEKLGITEVDYPVIYRNFENERNDPFYDRDYNLCILCGRCVRMCQELRGTSVLAFTHRGNQAIVGPAFGRSHIEAGCEFCGACVSVCPTGALAEKASKWDGKPDSSVISTCPYCAIGCQLELWSVDGKFSMALPVLDPEVNDGQACLKGRFSMGEVSHHFSRARKPMTKVGDYWREITWDEAFERAAGVLKDLEPGDFAMIVSPDLTNESLYTAQKFTRMAIGTNSIDSTARHNLSGGLNLWSYLFSKPLAINEIKNASRILAVGLDTRFNFSVIGVEVRKAIQKGTKLVTIDPRDSNLARYADTWLQPPPGFEGTLLKALADGKKKALKEAAKTCGFDSKLLTEAAEILKSGDDLFILIGPRVFRYSHIADLLNGITDFADNKNTTILPLYNGTNTRGAMEMGAFPELLPGDANYKKEELPTDTGITVDEIISGAKRPKVLYLVGAMPFFERPDCDFLIVQDIYEPDFECDLFLPAAGFLESSGTLINVEGRVQETHRVEELPDSVRFGRARPDWWIFAQIAQTLGVKGFKFGDVEKVRKEIAKFVDGFPKPGAVNRNRRTFKHTGKVAVPNPAKPPEQSDDGFILVLHPEGYTHRGISITSKVDGLKILNPENGFYIGCEDAEALGVEEGDMLKVKAGKAVGKAPVRIEPELPKGVIWLFVPDAFGGLADRVDLEALYRLDRNPVPVEVTKSGI